MSLQVTILTPERPFWNGQAEEIILPTETGEMGVLKNHAPIITGLDVGAMLIRTKEQWKSVAIMGGFAVVKRNQITILANEAEASETINPEEAKNEFEIVENLPFTLPKEVPLIFIMNFFIPFNKAKIF
jgi:ATP synthase F1 epsilon subunit